MVARLGAVLAAVALGPSLACGGGESGISPPSDRVFLPTGLAADPDGRWLYVVNSNSDLRFNAGTLAAVDLRQVAEDRSRRAQFPRCPSPSFQPPAGEAGRLCCRDFDNPNVLNCLDRPYVARDATVRIGSFGGVVALQCGHGGASCRPETPRRVFVAVRADPSVTYVDARVGGERIDLRCTAAGAGAVNPVCASEHRLSGFEDAEGRSRDLAEEPFTLTLDEPRGMLYAGHLFGGITAIDACPVEQRRPTVVGELTGVFADPRQGVSTLTPGPPDEENPTLFATGRLQVASYVAAAAQIQVVHVRDAGAPGACGAAGIPAPRPVRLAPGVGFVSPALYPGGKDIRGALLGPDGRHLFVLHRNADSRLHPAALAVIDRGAMQIASTSPASEAGGGSALATPNRAVDVIEVCAGATEMMFHDAGRGPHLFITCFEAGQVYVVDPLRITVAAVINLGRGPARLAVSAREPTIAFVSEFIDNDVAVVDLRPGSPTEYQVVQRIGFPHASKR